MAPVVCDGSQNNRLLCSLQAIRRVIAVEDILQLDLGISERGTSRMHDNETAALERKCKIDQKKKCCM